MKSFVIVTLSYLLLASAARGYTPELITYQGRLTDPSGTPLTGEFTVTFTIYSAAIGGIPYWSTVSPVSAESGLFTIILGESPMPPLSKDVVAGPSWLGITIEGSSELSPRTRLTAAPYALRADYATSSDVSNEAVVAKYCDSGAFAYWADSAQTARYADTAAVAIQASLAVSANAAINADTAGYARLADTASFARNADSSVIALTADVATLAPNYVRRTGDTILGALVFDDDGGGYEALMYAASSGGVIHLGNEGAARVSALGTSTGAIYLKDLDGHQTVSIESGTTGGGSIDLRQEDGSVGVNLVAGTNSNGSLLRLYDGPGAQGAYISSSGTGDTSVVLRPSSVSASEVLDEPGIAQAWNELSIPLTSTMTDLEVVTITTPSAGYIRVEGNCWVGIYQAVAGATAFAIIQIDETAGGTPSTSYSTYAGFLSGSPSTGEYYWPVYVSRVYFKPAGTYSFRMEAMKTVTSGGAASKNHNIIATFYPTSYGTVETLMEGSSASEFDKKAHLGGEQYRVDLRELELKAAKEREEALEAENALLKAKNVQLERKSTSSIETRKR